MTEIVQIVQISVFIQSPEVHLCPTPLEAAPTQEAGLGYLSSTAGLNPPSCQDHPPSEKSESEAEP